MSALEALWQGGQADSKALGQGSVLTWELGAAWGGALSVAAHSSRGSHIPVVPRMEMMV